MGKEFEDRGCENDRYEPEHNPWYSWQRWKWIGGALFLTLGSVVIGYAIWDEIDYRPKPIDWPVIRLILRELPLRIAGYLAMVGFISFGPPAGVDLMLGARKAAERWVKRMHEKDRAEVMAEGRKQGRQAERARTRKRLQALAENNPDVQRLLDELESEDAA